MAHGVSNEKIISPFSNCNYICLLHAVIIYSTLFIIVVLMLLYFSYSVIVCHVFVCICVYRDHNGTLLSYLMYFVFIFYVYLYNVLHFILIKINQSRWRCMLATRTFRGLCIILV